MKNSQDNSESLPLYQVYDRGFHNGKCRIAIIKRHPLPDNENNYVRVVFWEKGKGRLVDHEYNGNEGSIQMWYSYNNGKSFIKSYWTEEDLLLDYAWLFLL